MKKLKYFLCLMIVAIFGFTLVGCNDKPNGNDLEIISKESAQTMVLEGLDATYSSTHQTAINTTASANEKIYNHRNIFDCFKRAKFVETCRLDGVLYKEFDDFTGIIDMDGSNLKEYYLYMHTDIEEKSNPEALNNKVNERERYSPDGQNFYEYNITNKVFSEPSVMKGIHRIIFNITPL